MSKLTEKQRRFCDEYLISLNATAAYKAAGYAVKNDGVAAVEGHKLLDNPKVREYLRQRMEGKDRERIADQDEVLEYLTDVMRGNSQSETVVIEGTGKGKSRARHITKTPEEKERLKAAELLAKRYALFTPQQGADNAQVEDDGFIDALSESVADVWADHEESEEKEDVSSITGKMAESLIEQKAENARYRKYYETHREEPGKRITLTKGDITRRVRGEEEATRYEAQGYERYKPSKKTVKVSMEEMKTDELREWAAAHGIKGCDGLTREEVLSLIEHEMEQGNIE